MLKKRYYLWMMVMVTMIGLFSCKKDLGNYNYNEINEAVTFPGISDVVTATFGKQLLIEPKTVFSLDAAADSTKYSYQWTYIGPNGNGGSGLYVLANTRNLNVILPLVAGTYTCYYNVTDKASGVTYRRKFSLKVVNEINEGWFLMCDVNGTARVDMLSKKTTGEFELIKDLLATTSSGLVLKGKPVMTYTYSTGVLTGPDKISYGVYFGTDQSTQKVEPNTFKWTPTMGLKNEMYGDVPVDFYATEIRNCSGNGAYMLGKENAYLYSRPVNIFYTAPITYIAAEQKAVKIAPFIASETPSTDHAVFYDKVNRRFIKHVGSAPTCTVIQDPTGDLKKFSFSTGMDMIYMKWVRFNGGEVFSILKDPATAKIYLARFRSKDNLQSYFDEVKGTDFANAEQYAVSPDLGYIFYSVGSKVYEYDMSSKLSKLMLDLGTKKVTLLKFYEYLNYTKYTDLNKLMVASYDPTLPEGSNGTLSSYTVPPINGDLVLVNTYTGFGKVQSINYRER